MPHDTPLIATIVIGLSLAFVFGAIAHRLRVSPLVGYLLAGVAVGPHTPGFIADSSLSNELAEIGVILLMFGVGLHFSLKDLLSVRAIALPGAIAQIAVATLLGMALGTAMGWPVGAGLVFGLALSVASTVVLLRALQERRLVNTERGRIAVGWLIVEDIVMVLTLVMLPAISPLIGGTAEGGKPAPLDYGEIATTLLITIAKVMAFFAVMMLVGRRIIPWILHYTAHTGSRELFRLAVLAIALGVAYGAAQAFGVSFALGAFFAGMILSESELSQRAAQESLPLRDAFAVLFFVSVGILFDPTILIREPLPVLATVAIIVLGKSLAALAIVLAFQNPLSTALTIAVSLAQIGEFSFILASLGLSLKLLPEQGHDLILAGALLSILLNPLLFFALDKMQPRLDRKSPEPPTQPAPDQKSAPERDSPQTPVTAAPAPPSASQAPAVLVGYGRIGQRVAAVLERDGAPMIVIDESDDLIDKLKARGLDGVSGTGTAILKNLDLKAARALLVAVPDSFEAGQIVTQAKAANPALMIIASGYSAAEADHLKACGASHVVLGVEEIADAMLARLRRG